MKDKRLEEMKMEYENIEIPATLKSRVSMGIQQAKEENQQESGRQRSCPIWIRPCAFCGGDDRICDRGEQ